LNLWKPFTHSTSLGNVDVAIEIAGGRLIVAKPPIHSPKAFRASLRALEAAEIVVRHDMSGIVLHVEYDFAENMRPTMSRRNNK
jgi:hypothetical protein